MSGAREDSTELCHQQQLFYVNVTWLLSWHTRRIDRLTIRICIADNIATQLFDDIDLYFNNTCRLVHRCGHTTDISCTLSKLFKHQTRTITTYWGMWCPLLFHDLTLRIAISDLIMIIRWSRTILPVIKGEWATHSLVHCIKVSENRRHLRHKLDFWNKLEMFPSYLSMEQYIQ